MKLFGRKTLVGVVAATALTPFTAQATDQTGTSSAQISTVISLVENTQMDFAQISVDALGGTVTLTTAAAISATNGAYQFTGTPVAGQFTATGDASTAVTISFSTGDNLTDQDGNGGSPIPLLNFTHNGGGTPTLDGTGSLVFNVGADLTIGATQTASNYSGSYTVTVDYQ